MRRVQKITHKGKTFTREPEIRDYYKPSNEMEEYKHVAVGLMGLLGGWGVSKLVV